MMHHWIVASVSTDLRKHRSVEVLNDSARRQFYCTERNLEMLRAKRRRESCFQHAKYHPKRSNGDIAKDLSAYKHRTKKAPAKLFPPVQITLAQSWDDVTSCGKTPERAKGGDNLLSPSCSLPISRSKSQGDVTESIKSFHGRQSVLSPTLLSPSSPVYYGSFSNSHYLTPSTSCSELARSISDNDVRSDKVKLIKQRKRSGSWNCLKSPNTSSGENTPDVESMPFNYPLFHQERRSSQNVETFGRRTGEKGIRAWLGLTTKRTMSPQRKDHR